MKREDLTEKLLDIKREKGWTWKHICEQIGGMSRVLIAGAMLGQMKLIKPQAAKAGRAVRAVESEEAMLNEVPMRGTGTPMPPTDPLIYRFYELIMVNGPAWKALIEEEFGDGIMSAIDFDMAIERQRQPQGDRVKITMTGKFCRTNITARVEMCRSTDSRRGDASVIASAAKQSIPRHNGKMDCFVASLPCANASRLSQAMTVRGPVT